VLCCAGAVCTRQLPLRTVGALGSLGYSVMWILYFGLLFGVAGS